MKDQEFDMIHQVETQLLKAMSDHDLTNLSKFLHEDLLFVLPSGELSSKAADLHKFRSGKIQIASAELLHLNISSFEKHVISVSLSYLRGSFGGEYFEGKFRYIRNWHLFEDGWKVIGGAGMAVQE